MCHRFSKKKEGCLRKNKLIKCSDTGECFSSYKAYLMSDHWKNFRYQYFSEHEHKCSRCETGNGAIHLHHITYDHVGYESFFDVIPLCKLCHKAEHASKKRSTKRKKPKKKTNGRKRKRVAKSNNKLDELKSQQRANYSYNTELLIMKIEGMAKRKPKA
jgi:hypothetical protein